LGSHQSHRRPIITIEPHQLYHEGNKFHTAFTQAIVMIIIALAVQFNFFRDPLIIRLGSVSLATFGALIISFLKRPNPSMPYWITPLNMYAQMGLATLVSFIAKNGILIVEFTNNLQE
jgi:multidrug efflux pump